MTSNLSDLSRQQKEELLKLLQQRALLDKESVLETFAPHAGQERFLKSPAKLRAMFSGNGFGKTTALAIDLIWTHLRRHPYRDTSDVMHSWLLVPSLDKAEDYYAEIKKWCPPSQLPSPHKLGSSNIRRFEWPNGSITTIYSHEQDSDKLEGTNLDALYCDEPPPRALWIAAYRGLRNNRNYQIVLAGTPLSAAWLYDEVYLKWAMKTDPNIEVIQGSTYQNPHLSKDFIKDFESRLTEDERKTRIEGEFTFLQGRVFKEFSRQTHVFKYQTWPEEWPVWVGIDPHPRKPHTAVYVGVTPDDLIVVLDEIKMEGTVEELAEAMMRKEKANGYKVVCRRIDNSGSGTDWSRDSAVSQLDKWSREHNYNVRVSPMRKSEKDVANSIHKIKLLLKDSKLRFLDNCIHTIKDMEMYQWDDYVHPETAGVREKPKKIYDDFIDPLRYVIASNPIHSPTLTYLKTASTLAYNKD